MTRSTLMRITWLSLESTLLTLSIFTTIRNKLTESTQIIETLGEEDEEYKLNYQSKWSTATDYNILQFKKKEGGISSFRSSKRQSKLNVSAGATQGLPSVSVSAMRRNETKDKKSSLLRQIKKRHPNSRLFKADVIQERPTPGTNAILVQF